MGIENTNNRAESMFSAVRSVDFGGYTNHKFENVVKKEPILEGSTKEKVTLQKTVKSERKSGHPEIKIEFFKVVRFMGII